MNKMWTKLILPLILIIVALAGVSWADTSAKNKLDLLKEDLIPDRNILKGIELLYDWDFDDAESIFQKYIENHPDKPLGYFYHAMVTWSRLASGFWSPETVAEYERRVDQTVAIATRKIERGQADSFTYFYMGGALGFKGRLQLMEHKWFQSFNLAVNSIKALKKCQELDPNNKDVLLGLGIYDYYTARLSGVLKFLTYLFIRKGNVEEGIRKLNLAANEAVYASVEAKSVLLHIYLFMESDYEKALPLAIELAERFKNNPRQSYFLGLVYLKLYKKDDYLSVLQLMREREERYKGSDNSLIWRHRVLYLESCDDIFMKHYDQAREKLEMILKEVDKTVDPSMAAFPLLKIGMIYDLEGKRNIAIDYYNKVMMMYNGAGAQFLAERFYDHPPSTDDPFLGY